MLLNSTIPFEHFWSNYGNFQLQNPKNNSGVSKGLCSFENIKAIEDASKQSFGDLRFLTQVTDNSSARSCPCSSSLNFFSSGYLSNLNQRHESSQSFPSILSENNHNTYCPLPSPSRISDEISFDMNGTEEDAEDYFSSHEDSSPISSPPPLCIDSPPTPMKEEPSEGATFVKPEPNITIKEEPQAEVIEKVEESRTYVTVKEEPQIDKNDEEPRANVKPDPTPSESKVEEREQKVKSKPRRKNFDKLDTSYESHIIDPPIVPKTSKRAREPEYRAKSKRFEWSAELHEHFIRAYEKLSESGYPTPKQIMVEMELDGAGHLMENLTRIHVNTHLQKYELSKIQKPKRNSKFFAFRVGTIPEEPKQKRKRARRSKESTLDESVKVKADTKSKEIDDDEDSPPNIERSVSPLPININPSNSAPKSAPPQPHKKS